MPRRPSSPPLSSLDDGSLVRRALELHRVAGELSRGILARMAALLGVNRATVTRAGAGRAVNLRAEARRALEEHVTDPVKHPLPPSSTLRGRPRADAPPLDPDRRRSRGGARRGDAPRAGADRPHVWLTAEEKAAVLDLAEERGMTAVELVAEALASYAQRPDAAPPVPPEGAKRCRWQVGASAVAAFDAAVGSRGRREHARAAIVRVLGAAKKKNEGLDSR